MTLLDVQQSSNGWDAHVQACHIAPLAWLEVAFQQMITSPGVCYRFQGP